MFSRLKSALGGKAEESNGGLRGAIVDRLRGMRGGEGAAPPEPIRAVVPAQRPVPARPAAEVPVVAKTPAVAEVPAVAKTPDSTPALAVAKTPAPAPVAAKTPDPTPALAVAKTPAPAPVAPPPAATAPVETPKVAAAPVEHPKAHKPAPPPAAPESPKIEATPPKAVAEPVKVVKPSLAALAAAAGATKIVHADMGSTDLEHYIARAKANGRDLSLIKGTEGLNKAEDGEAYWGPVDNESSRAKAAEKLLTIDQWECISCGTCVEQTDKVFFLPADAKATPIAQDGPMDLIQDAIEACPVTCIHWVTPGEAAEKGLATGNEPDSPRPE